jgi:hypothetical protein
MAKVVLYPFEVLVIERGGTEEAPTAKIVKPIEIMFSKNGQDLPLKVAMNLGSEFADKAENIDILVRPFVKG